MLPVYRNKWWGWFLLLLLVLSFIAYDLLISKNEKEFVQEQKIQLKELLIENRLFEEMKFLRKYYEKGEVEQFRFYDDNQVFETFFLYFSVGARGDRSISITFDESGRYILYTNDTNKWFNGGLLDKNNDGYVDKIVAYTVETGGAGKGAVYDVIRFYSFVKGHAILLLDVNYNLDASPGNNNYLVVDYDDDGVCLRNYNGDVVRFVWSFNSNSFVQAQEGSMGNNWKVIKMGSFE